MKLLKLLVLLMISYASALKINDETRSTSVIETETTPLRGSRNLEDTGKYYDDATTDDGAVAGDDDDDDDGVATDDGESVSLAQKLKQYQAQLQQYQYQLSVYQAQLMEYEETFTDNVNDNYLPEGYYISAIEMLYVLGATFFCIILVMIYLCIGPSQETKQRYRRNRNGYYS